MSARLNLATDPFRNRALPWTVTALVVVASVAGLLFIAEATFQTNAKILSTQREVADLRKQSDTLAARAKAIETALTDQQKRELKYAHALVDRKRFSWSRCSISSRCRSSSKTRWSGGTTTVCRNCSSCPTPCRCAARSSVGTAGRSSWKPSPTPGPSSLSGCPLPLNVRRRRA